MSTAHMVCRISLLLKMALLLIRLPPQTRRMITAMMMARTLTSAARSQTTRAASNLTTKHEYGGSKAVVRRFLGGYAGMSRDTMQLTLNDAALIVSEGLSQ